MTTTSVPAAPAAEPVASPNSVPMTIDEAIQRYPILLSHMICESLGYFTPRSAANALAAHKNGHDSASELFMHLSGDGKTLRETGRDFIDSAFRRRMHHRGFMAHHLQARRIVEAERAGASPRRFSSWQ